MNFSTDRDLLLLEPNVFRDVPFSSQQRLRVTDGVLAGTTLTSALADFEASDVDAGGVAIVAGVPMEVISRISAGALEVSLPRASLADSPIPGTSGAGLEIVVRTFAPQAAVVRDMLLRLIGADPDDVHAAIDPDAIVSISEMARLEALGTLERVYSAALSVESENRALARKAELARRQFAAACRRAVILLDTDGDGRADDARRLSVVHLVRD